MRVLVTGAGGFIGGHVVEACVERGDDVSALDIRSLGGQWSHFNDAADNYEMQGLVETRLPPFDVCYHLAAMSRVGPSFVDPLGCVTNNVLGTACVLEAARKYAGRVVYAGSVACQDDPPTSVYGVTKGMGEDLCRLWRDLFGVRVTCVRLPNVYGPRNYRTGPLATVVGIFEQAYLDGKPMPVARPGTQVREYVHVNDITKALLTIGDMVDVHKTHGLCGDKMTLLEVASLFSDDVHMIDRTPGDHNYRVVDGCGYMFQCETKLADYVDEFKAENPR